MGLCGSHQELSREDSVVHVRRDKTRTSLQDVLDKSQADQRPKWLDAAFYRHLFADPDPSP